LYGVVQASYTPAPAAGVGTTVAFPVASVLQNASRVWLCDVSDAAVWQSTHCRPAVRYVELFVCFACAPTFTPVVAPVASVGGADFQFASTVVADCSFAASPWQSVHPSVAPHCALFPPWQLIPLHVSVASSYVNVIPVFGDTFRALLVCVPPPVTIAPVAVTVVGWQFTHCVFAVAGVPLVTCFAWLFRVFTFVVTFA
jgi:hypothetical protein